MPVTLRCMDIPAWFGHRVYKWDNYNRIVFASLDTESFPHF